MRSLIPLTIEQRCAIGGTLLLIRHGMAEVTSALSGRVTAAIMDSALNVERRLFTLTLRMRDTLEDADFSRYPFDLPPTAAPRLLRRQHLTPAEHWSLGPKLDRLRSMMMTTSIEIANGFRKGSHVGRAAHLPDRAIDRLRCQLDCLFCRQHPGAFQPRAYYPCPPVTDLPWPTLPHVASKGVGIANVPSAVPVAHVGHLLAHQGVPSEN